MTHHKFVKVQLDQHQDILELTKFYQFKEYLISELKLDAINQYLPEMARKTFFLLAATGLGKTVIVPIHNWLEIFNRVKSTSEYLWNSKFKPTVYVVVPTVTIAEDQVAFLNSMFDKFCRNEGLNAKSLFGCKTIKGSTNNNAPIQFVTTGVFEAMAMNQSFVVNIHSIIIDEAHKTLETSPNFEIALTNVKYSKVRVDYMSATVDTDGLQERLGVETFIKADAIRHPIFKHNTNLSMADSIVDVIGNCICDFNHRSKYIPQGLFMGRDFIRELSDQWRHRPSAMLAIVNSKKDIEAITSIVNQNFPDFPVLAFSSAIKKSPTISKQFSDKIAHYTKKNQNYLIISTNVVEMGVTFDNLDWVITKDQEYTNSDNDLQLTPLKVNALYQRLGRVGRKGVGIGIITNDGQSYYSSLDDSELNNLKNEPIDFPCTSNGFQAIAMNTLTLGWSDQEMITQLTTWNCPSQIHKAPSSIEYIIKHRQELKLSGVIDSSSNSMTTRGKIINQLMSYTCLDSANCVSILDAYQNNNWAEFGFEISRSIVMRYSLVDFGDRKCNQLEIQISAINESNYYTVFCEKSQTLIGENLFYNRASNFESINEVFAFFIRSQYQAVKDKTSSNLGETNECLSLLKSVSMSYQYSDVSPPKPLRVIERFRSDFLTLATAVYNALARSMDNVEIPIFEVTKNGKNYTVTDFNLLMYNGTYTPLHTDNWRLLNLTGNARISLNGRDYQDIKIIEDLTNFNTTNILEYEWINQTSGIVGWVSPLTFHILSNEKYAQGEQFYGLIKEDKDYEGNTYWKLLNTYYGSLPSIPKYDLSSYYPAIDIDDDQDERNNEDYLRHLEELDTDPDDITNVVSEVISDLFQDSINYQECLQAFHNTYEFYRFIDSELKSDSFQSSIIYSECLKVFEDKNECFDVIDSSSKSDRFQNTQEYYALLKTFVFLGELHYLLNGDLPYTVTEVSSQSIERKEPIIDFQTTTEYSECLKVFEDNNECFDVIDSSSKSDRFQNTQEYYALLKTFVFLGELHYFLNGDLPYTITEVSSQSTEPKEPIIDFQTTTEYYGLLEVFQYNVQLELQYEYEIKAKREANQEAQKPEPTTRINYTYTKDKSATRRPESDNVALMETLFTKVLYKHIGGVFWVGTNYKNELVAFATSNQEQMKIVNINNDTIDILCKHTGKNYRVFNFVTKYMKT
jgi:hypothetical protein